MDNSNHKPSLSHFFTIRGKKTFLCEIHTFFFLSSLFSFLSKLTKKILFSFCSISFLPFSSYTSKGEVLVGGSRCMFCVSYEIYGRFNSLLECSRSGVVNGEGCRRVGTTTRKLWICGQKKKKYKHIKKIEK